MSSHDTPLMVPALRASMGAWIYYIGFMKMSDIAQRVSIVEDIHYSESLQELLQRQLKPRSSEIADYLLNQEQRFFNSLVIGTYGGKPEWFELEVKPTTPNEEKTLIELEGKVGFLSLTGTETLFALDGQHRVAGIKKAFDKDVSIGKDEVSVIFVAGIIQKRRHEDPKGFERTRRLFTTLNRYAKPVNKQDIVALDEDDAVAIITRKLVEEHPLFVNRTSAKGTNSIRVNDQSSITTIVNLYDIMDIYLVDKINEFPHGKRKRPSDKEIEQLYKFVSELWKQMIKFFKPLQELYDNPPEAKVAGRYRNRDGGNLLFRPIGLKMIITTIILFGKIDVPLRDALTRICKAKLTLEKPPWAGLLWNSTSKRMITASENQKAATLMLFYATGGNLEKIDNSESQLRKDVAGLTNKDVDEIHLPKYF